MNDKNNLGMGNINRMIITWSVIEDFERKNIILIKLKNFDPLSKNPGTNSHEISHEYLP